MPTNEERRAAAKRTLEHQLQRRARNARRGRILTIAASVTAAVAVIAAVTTGVVLVKRDSDDTATASAPTSTENADSSEDSANAAGQLPQFHPSADLGGNCQYPATPDAASKTVEPPRSGKVPTDPAEVSVSMVTDQGPIGLLLDNGKAPCTVNSFVSLAQKDFFNDTQCHRLTTSPTLGVLQCGDPTGEGAGGPGYSFANEYPTDQYQAGDPALQMPVSYPRGTLAMAHSSQPDSNGSQFFLVYQDSTLPPDYTVFGKIQDDGLATLDKVAEAGTDGGGEDGPPAAAVTITSVRVD